MPTSAAEARAALIALTGLARRDLFALWQQLADLPPDQLGDALADLLPLLGDRYGLAAATLAADWYDDLREASEVPGRFLAEPAALPDDARYQSLARWGVSPMFGANPEPLAALGLVWGGMQRTIADAHRLTIVDNSIRDPQASGWKRVGVGECSFCALLISRGSVYQESTARFASHDNCRCSAVPAFNGDPVPVNPYTPSTRSISDADRARVREYLRTH